MAQTTQGQAKAQARWATQAMKSQRANEAAVDKVAPALRPNVPLGATKHNQAALTKAKKISDAGL